MTAHDDRCASRPTADDALSTLLREAGPRPEVEPLRRARVERHVRNAWQAQLRRRRLRHWSVAAAAGLAAAAAALGMLVAPGAPAADVGVLVHASGLVYRIEGGQRSRLAVGDRVRAGDRLETAAESFANLSLARIDSLRLDRSTRLQLEDATQLRLEHGRVYLDSGQGAGGLTVTTPRLEARDIGTRFQVSHGEHSEVMVRDGAVMVSAAGAEPLTAGERVRIGAGRSIRRDQVPTHGDDWDWATQAAVPFAAEGRSLAELLAWYARESGLVLRVADDTALALRLQAPLEGSLHGLEPAQLLEVARIASGVSLRIDRATGELHVAP